MQHLPDHPASAEEYAHLQATCDVIDEEITKLEKDTGVGVAEKEERSDSSSVPARKNFMGVGSVCASAAASSIVAG